MNKHLQFIDSLGCCICGMQATHHHLLRVDYEDLPIMDCELFLIPKRRERGMGIKNDDRFCIPLCHYHHMSLHNHGDEMDYLEIFGIKEPTKLALYLWEHTGDYEKCLIKVRGYKWNSKR